MTNVRRFGRIFCSLLLTASPAAFAQTSPGGLDEIVITAQHRTENLQLVPLSVAAVAGEKLDALQSGGVDIRGLSARVPSLLIESSFGRTFPRFYIRGLGNTDFDLNASQPVSLVYDEVVLENPILKGFPVFDLERVEVLRGPQGTLFGRNTPAGIVKFESVKPQQEAGGFARLSYGRFGTLQFDGAAGGGLSETAAIRASVVYKHRDDWVDNVRQSGGNDRGGYDDIAARLQFSIAPHEALDVRLTGQLRILKGSSQIFYANAFRPGSNDLGTAANNGAPGFSAFDRTRIAADGVTFLKLENQNISLNVAYDFGPARLTSITSYWHGTIASRGDVDGGFGASFLPEFGPGVIPFAAETEDTIPGLDQLTQEVRLASTGDSRLSYQGGLFYFHEKLRIESFNYDSLFGGVNDITAKQRQTSKAFGVFGSATFSITPTLKINGGVRYNNDRRKFVATREKAINPFAFPGLLGSVPLEVQADNVTWDASVTYTPGNDQTLYARAARGYRAPSIQGRILFPPSTALADGVTTARSETIQSYEVGLKSRMLDGRARFNLSGFYYRVKDLQLTAVGGGINANRLLNAARVDGYGFEAEAEAKPVDLLLLTAGLSYNNTQIKDPALTTSACGSPCALLDPVVIPGTKIVSIDGNSLPQSPRWVANVTARLALPLGNGGELYAFTDWAYRSRISFFLYDSREFTDDNLLEGGLRVGFTNAAKNWDIAAYVRNITNDVSAVTAVDFNNLTAIVNEPRIWGVEVGLKF